MPEYADDVALLGKLAEARKRIQGELAKVIVGQDRVVEEMLTAVFARGHVLLVGVPGLAKTLLVSSLARCLRLDFKRIQFTPDLMPSDITGTTVLQEDPATRQRIFRFIRGPVFTNILLADEINRTPPKTQAALLEAMQERKVSVDGQDHVLDAPFFVLATQNPIEQEGTYPLPEAQLDRFLFHVDVGYPSAAEEMEIMRRATREDFGTGENAVQAALSGEEVIALQNLVRRVPAADHVLLFAKQMVRATRPGGAEASAMAGKYVAWGAGPRASISIILAAKSHAAIYGRLHATVDDVAAVALPAMRHRIGLNYGAQAEGVTTDAVIQKLLEDTPRDERLLAAAGGK
jgi:MoxR-like ATPase